MSWHFLIIVWDFAGPNRLIYSTPKISLMHGSITQRMGSVDHYSSDLAWGNQNRQAPTRPGRAELHALEVVAKNCDHGSSHE